MPLIDTTAEIKRIDAVEEMMSSGLQIRRLGPRVAERFGISRRQATAYIKAVTDRWRRESAEQREDKRAHIEATLWSLYRKATNKKTIYIQRGKKPEDDREIKQDDPDIRGAATILQMIGLMHGVIEPVKVDARSVHLHGTSDAETLKRIRRSYFGNEIDEPAALSEAIDVEGE